ncbi:hypothetical protein NFI96_005142 [Prochilodus magdalenae]|nr:hypothetical protein NFI96_005142 [Prochilodus magdalenae]
MTVWYDTTAAFGDGDVVLRTVVVTVCVHVVLRGAAVCRWCCTNRRTHGGHHCSLEVCNGGVGSVRVSGIIRLPNPRAGNTVQLQGLAARAVTSLGVDGHGYARNMTRPTAQRPVSLLLFFVLQSNTQLYSSYSIQARTSVCESRSGVVMEVVPRFSSSSLTYLPVSCQLLGAESTSFFLREAGQEVMRNGSLQTRTETLFLHQPSGPSPLLSVNCSYGNLTADTPVPSEILQGALTPASTHLTPAAHLAPGWKVRAHLVTTVIRAERPQVHLLFYLAGRR